MQTYQSKAIHDPDLYKTSRTAEPLQGFQSVGPDQYKQYYEQGFLAVENAFARSEIDDAIAGLSHLILGRNPDFKTIQFEQRLLENVPEDDLAAHELAVRKIMYFVDYEPRLKALAHHHELLAIVTKLLNNQQPELFQDMALVKPPGGSEKPWHQDKAYFNYPLETPVVGVWIALDHATLDNGCMHLLPGQHHEPVIHFQKRDWQICDTHILGQTRHAGIAVPLKPGGCLIFHGLLPHGTPHNHSNTRRRALQFHYMPRDTQSVPVEERLAVFGSEGKQVEC